MKKEILKNLPFVILAVLFNMLIAGVEIFVAFLIKDIIDASTTQEMSRLFTALIYLIVIVAFDILFNYLGSYTLNKFGCNVTIGIRTRAAKSILRLSHKEFRNYSTSYYTNILTKDIDMLESDYLRALVKSIYNVFQITFGTVAVLTLSWKMALGILITMAVPLFIPAFTGSVLSRAMNIYSNKSEKHLSMIKQLLEGFDLIKSNQIEENIIRQYDKENEARGKKRFRYFYLFDLFNSITQDVSFLTMTALFGLGAYLMIVIHDLYYKYGEIDILNGISLSLEYRKKYAIIGLSGAGKSTLIKLIAGIHPDYQGEILYDGFNIAKLDLESVRKYITFIHQETFLFDDNMENNITLYKSYPKKEIKEAIKMTKLDKVIEGTDIRTRNVGEFGIGVSGGERQRIAVARGILRKTPIYMLDEITASLDPQTEEEIYNIMLSMYDTTIIAVTHNWNTEFLCRFDHVIVLDNGKVREILEPSSIGRLQKYV